MVLLFNLPFTFFCLSGLIKPIKQQQKYQSLDFMRTLGKSSILRPYSPQGPILLFYTSTSNCHCCLIQTSNAAYTQGAEESNSTEISIKFTVSMHCRSILFFKAP